MSSPIPFLTGNLDTSTEGYHAISEQVATLVDYNNEQYESPAIIAESPEGNVEGANAFGTSEDNDTPVDGDTVGSTVLNDGKKDTADEVGKERVATRRTRTKK